MRGAGSLPGDKWWRVTNCDLPDGSGAGIMLEFEDDAGISVTIALADEAREFAQAIFDAAPRIAGECGQNDKPLMGENPIERLAGERAHSCDEVARAMLAERSLVVIQHCRISDSSAIEAIENLVAQANIGFARQALTDEVPF